MWCHGHQRKGPNSRPNIFAYIHTLTHGELAAWIPRRLSAGRVPKPQQLLQADDGGTGALGDESSPREETRRKLLLRGMGGMGRGGGFRWGISLIPTTPASYRHPPARHVHLPLTCRLGNSLLPGLRQLVARCSPLPSPSSPIHRGAQLCFQARAAAALWVVLKACRDARLHATSAGPKQSSDVAEPAGAFHNPLCWAVASGRIGQAVQVQEQRRSSCGGGCCPAAAGLEPPPPRGWCPHVPRQPQPEQAAPSRGSRRAAPAGSGGGAREPQPSPCYP